MRLSSVSALRIYGACERSSHKAPLDWPRRCYLLTIDPDDTAHTDVFEFSNTMASFVSLWNFCFLDNRSGRGLGG